MRPIDADALMEFARNDVRRVVDCNDIARFPTIDVAPVVHGRWVNYTGVNGGGYACYRYRCSECGTPAIVNGYDRDMQTSFCPWCGAKMDLKEPTNE